MYWCSYGASLVSWSHLAEDKCAAILAPLTAVTLRLRNPHTGALSRMCLGYI